MTGYTKTTHESEIASAQPGPTNRQSCWEIGIWASSHRTEETQMLVLPLSTSQIIGPVISLGVWLVFDCHINSIILRLQMLIRSYPNFARLLFLLLHQIQCAQCNIYKSKQLWMFWGYTPKNWHSPWKMVVGRQSFPFGKVTFQGRTVKLRGGICKCPGPDMPVSKTTHTSDSSRTSACAVASQKGN